MTLDEAVALLLRYYQHGLADNARMVCDAILVAAPGHPVATRYRTYLDRPTPEREGPTAFTVIWQTDRTAFDGSVDWVRGLLTDLAVTEIIDGTHSVMTDRAIVVDQKLDATKLPYYQAAFAKGYRFGILHLSDEGYMDDTEAYRHCDFVIRNYWSVFHCDNPRILTVALGYQGILRSAGAARTAGERSLLWSFAGDPNKSSRPAMLEALSPLGPRTVHLTSAFFDPNALDTDAYRRLLEDSLFAPCPCGFVNLDSFRVYEALECGCIPIVERRPGFDYFSSLFGPHPLVTVTDWSEARAVVASLGADPAAAERRRADCVEWWQRIKATHRRDIALLAHRATAVNPRCLTVPALW